MNSRPLGSKSLFQFEFPAVERPIIREKKKEPQFCMNCNREAELRETHIGYKVLLLCSNCRKRLKRDSKIEHGHLIF